MKDIKGIKGRYYIASLIEEGEHEHQDFKFAVPDARKIARSLSAFANNDGGRLLIGVKDNGVIAGVRNEEDIYVVEQAAEMYCVPSQKIRVTAFKTDCGLVMRVEIDKAWKRPVSVKEVDGTLKAYFRVDDENIAVSPLVVRAWRAVSSGSTCGIVNIGGVARRLLALASAQGGTSLEEFMIGEHISHTVAEDTVVSLHSMGLLDFRYDGHSFKLVTTNG